MNPTDPAESSPPRRRVRGPFVIAIVLAIAAALGMWILHSITR